MNPKIRRIGLPLAIVAAGVVVLVLLASSRSGPQRRPAAVAAPLVEAVGVVPEDVTVTVTGQGTVEARRTVQIVPQVSGKVVATHPELVPGGTFRRGELLIALESADYELAVQRARADVARARTALDVQRAEADVARAEWDRIHPGEEPSPLVVRTPQVEQAEAELAAARANLADARLALERTRITAPWDGRVETESVDPGQYAVAGQPLATVYGTEVLEVPVPLEDDELVWFDAGEGSGGGAPATVVTTAGGVPTRIPARIVRTEGVDPRTRMTRVVARVEDAPPTLRPGMFVDVEIEGRTVPGLLPVPRHALHPDDEVWVVADGTLRIRPVEVVHADRDTAYVGSGLGAGDRIVTTSLETVTDGMAVRIAGAGGGDGGDPDGGAGGERARGGTDRDRTDAAGGGG